MCGCVRPCVALCGTLSTLLWPQGDPTHPTSGVFKLSLAASQTGLCHTPTESVVWAVFALSPMDWCAVLDGRWPPPTPPHPPPRLSDRVHPCETSASWMIKGLIDFLTDGDNPEAKWLRDHFVWKVVPMLNPDGVMNGNSRCERVLL